MELYTCAECGAAVREADARCTGCGVEIVDLREHERDHRRRIARGSYPSGLNELVVIDAHGRTYLGGRTTVALDPWKNRYQYEPPAPARPYRVWSFGKDGLPGGSGDDADVTSEHLLDELR